jgi:hypothetical protein
MKNSSNGVGGIHQNNDFYAGGDGSSIESAIIINITDRWMGVPAEYDYVQSLYGTRRKDWNLKKQTLHLHDSKYYDILEIELSNGENKTLHFDITNFYGKY